MTLTSRFICTTLAADRSSHLAAGRSWRTWNICRCLAPGPSCSWPLGSSAVQASLHLPSLYALRQRLYRNRHRRGAQDMMRPSLARNYRRNSRAQLTKKTIAHPGLDHFPCLGQIHSVKNKPFYCQSSLSTTPVRNLQCQEQAFLLSREARKLEPKWLRMCVWVDEATIFHA